MRSRQEKRTSARSTEKLTEAFADNEEWLAVLDEAVYQYQKKTVRKMILKDHKRPDGRAINQIRPLAAEIDHHPESTWFCYVYTWTDTDLYISTTLAPLVRSTEDLMVWMSSKLQRDICITIISRPTL